LTVRLARGSIKAGHQLLTQGHNSEEDSSHPANLSPSVCPAQEGVNLYDDDYEPAQRSSSAMSEPAAPVDKSSHADPNFPGHDKPLATAATAARSGDSRAKKR